MVGMYITRLLIACVPGPCGKIYAEGEDRLMNFLPEWLTGCESLDTDNAVHL